MTNSRPLHLRYSSRLERLRLLSPKAAEVQAVVDQAAVGQEPAGPDLAHQARVAPAAQHPAKREPLSPVQRVQVDQAAEAAVPRRVCDAKGSPSRIGHKTASQGSIGVNNELQ